MQLPWRSGVSANSGLLRADATVGHRQTLQRQDETGKGGDEGGVVQGWGGWRFDKQCRCNMSRTPGGIWLQIDVIDLLPKVRKA